MTEIAPKVGLYPGTFDPITYGHLDIVRRGLKLVDRLVMGVATNPGKQPLFSLEERCAMVERETAPLAEKAGAEIEVVAFDELLMHIAEKVGAHIIIRGLRAVSDFEYEFQMAGMNTQLNPNIETVFLMADAKYQPIASKLVKEIAHYGGSIDGFIPPLVADALRAKVEDKA
ncbi:phosphopantetheine adenylyltransferase [Rhodothalassium salexigens DSM 2132]|uniref:Phosphopantetheine adenylyltransferase n=1 Tax=Rhodothalassium salexigens DSM 2132 TaxID=1188247 RepID=A0A4R2PPS1_RHOSA|nr:pantetheine-phosphate adenylyltransferase [Rhodothalassium salexigens]MBB4210684.1 pantetheine-phosphate adenylyltransferase [Rhodothalassium salexigens DSM 2132]TCP37760.1 phosphopantetheine adenylyltransferase [Rhodothalassium salexigens DSM 2132]